MKSILIIGMGRFGQHLCKNLYDLGNQVMIIDENEEKLEGMLGFAANAKIGDCTNIDVLKSLGVSNFDTVFVCIGTNFQSSLEATSLVKELGAKHVISKANRDIHAKFLLKNGADEVIYPDRDIAERVAIKNSADKLFDYIEISEDLSVYEILPPKLWVGKTLKELNLPHRYGISVLGVKKNSKTKLMPRADYVVEENLHLMIAAKKSDTEEILKELME